MGVRQMAIVSEDLETRKGTEAEVELEELWRRSETRREPRRVSSANWHRRLMLGWIGLIVGALVLEPAPAANATLPLWAELLGITFTFGLLGTFFALATKAPRALQISLVTSLLAFGMAAACGITDHHPAAWWGFEMVASGALVGASATALRRRGAAG
ncbi:MAG: hypothetical protein ABR529_06435 [Actinomycetota bacterium]